MKKMIVNKRRVLISVVLSIPVIVWNALSHYFVLESFLFYDHFSEDILIFMLLHILPRALFLMIGYVLAFEVFGDLKKYLHYQDIDDSEERKVQEGEKTFDIYMGIMIIILGVGMGVVTFYFMEVSGYNEFWLNFIKSVFEELKDWIGF